MRTIALLLLLVIKILLFSNANAQSSYLHLDGLSFFEGSVVIDENKFKIKESPSSLTIPYLENGKAIESTIINVYSLVSLDSLHHFIKITQFLDSVFFYEEHDSTQFLLAKGFLKPNLLDTFYLSYQVINPETLEEFTSYYNHLRFKKEGHWQIHQKESYYELGSFENNAKIGEWYTINTEIPNEYPIDKKTYNGDTLTQLIISDFVYHQKDFKQFIKGNWHFYSLINLPKSNEYYLASIKDLNDFRLQEIAKLEFVAKDKILFKKNFSCLTGVNLEKEHAPQAYKIEKKCDKLW